MNDELAELKFRTRDSYLAWRTAWRAEWHRLVALIRDHKDGRTGPDPAKRAIHQSARETCRREARAMMELRASSKVKAGKQMAKARERERVAA